MNDISLFYKGFDESTKIDDFLEDLKAYSESNMNGNSVYVIKRPLGDKKYIYEYNDAILVLIPKHKLLFIDYGENEEAFDEYIDEFLEDVGHISDKYEYMAVLGRVSKWRNKFVEQMPYSNIKNMSLEELLDLIVIKDKAMSRKGEFLISLLTGSINDINKTGIEYPETILEKIKRKIVLFDGDQTRFIYDEPYEKRIVIQGLAGTGKTELLLHKIKEIYTHNSNVKIAFTCYNKILAENLKNRIPQFFDFMKVQEQIKWNEKLWVLGSWGSKANQDSGLYSYICNYYNIPFERFSYSVTFDSVCKNAINNLKEIQDIKPCFDYILIDESQDFSESFFDLCEMVTSRCVYVAGDIFQNIFYDENISSVTPQFLLNKCYRTDPKTLMCAHAIGMGLFEKHNELRWLADEAWKDCGYDISKGDGYYNLYRKPLRRFQDLGDVNLTSLKMYPTKSEDYIEKIMTIIRDIRKENETIEPDDIGIMFLENINDNYSITKQLQVSILEEFGWTVNIGYETKEKIKGTLFISNKNNVKGLEFPFVICFMQGKLTKDLQSRNSIYMMLTRSFITSYFILPEDASDMLESIMEGVDYVNKNGYLHIFEPSDEEKESINNAIINRSGIHKSQRDIAEEIMNELGIPEDIHNAFHTIISSLYKEEYDREKLYDIIQTNYSLMGRK